MNQRKTPPLENEEMQPLYATWEALLAKGAEINARDTMERTPLHFAAMRAAFPVDALVWLVEHGANLEAADKDGRTALEYAQSLSLDRRLELEIRYRFPKWTAERAIKTLILCPGLYALKPLTFDAAGEAASPPTARDLLLRIFEELKDSPPNQFNLRIYRAEAGKEVTQFAKLALNVDAKFPETPELRWGDVLVVECDDQATSGGGRIITRPRSPGNSNELFLRWLRAVEPSATPEAGAKKTPPEKSSAEGAQVQP